MLEEISDLDDFRKNKPKKLANGPYQKILKYFDKLEENGVNVQKTICTIDEDESKYQDFECQTSFDLDSANLECVRVATAVSMKKDEMKQNIEKTLKEDEQKPRENYCDMCMYKDHIEA